MNQNIYRVIFSQARGLWMAVRETASSCRAGPACALLLAAPIAWAQIIADPAAPGRQRPTVLPSANGTPTVNIQTPSAGGVSRNLYQQFDIGPERGAILNNSRSAVPSQIGGWVQGNPWLAKGSARVIVNEVNSAAQSRLMGPLEVAGPRADVIIANPSGLAVNGLSLINAAGLTLTTGTPLYAGSGNLDGFRVQAGSIDFQGKGLDASRTDYAQVLARAIAVNAEVQAQDLRMVLGANNLAADGSLQQSRADAALPPRFALDVAHLGGMYAGKIVLIGTEAGLGVRNAGTLSATAGPLSLSADGELRNTGVLTSHGAGGQLKVAAQAIDNSGSLAAPRLEITAARMLNSGLITQTGMQALRISSPALSNMGENAVLGAPPANHETAPSSVPPALASGTIYVAERLDNTGQLTANGAVDIKTIRSFVNRAKARLRQLHSEGVLDNRAGLLQLQGLGGAQTVVLNQTGSLWADQDLQLTASHIDNSRGAIASAQALRIQAQTIANAGGSITAQQDLRIQSRGLVDNRAGQVAAKGDMALVFADDITHQGSMATDGKLSLETTGRLINQGQIRGGSSAALTGRHIDNRNGAEISAAQATSLKATQKLSNQGLIDGQDMRIDADSVDNVATGRIYGGHVSIAAKTLDNRSEHGAAAVIAARQDLDLGVPVVTNQGDATLLSLGDMRLGASLDAHRMATGQGRVLHNQGARIYAQGHMKLDLAIVNNANPDLKIAPLAEVEKKPGEDLISFPGKAPDSAALYREVEPNHFVPSSANADGPMTLDGIPGSRSDGRMFKPVHVDKFLSTLPAAFIANTAPSPYGDKFPGDIPLHMEPEGSARFAEFGIPLPKHYTSTAPTPWKFGAAFSESGEVEWGYGADKKAFNAAWSAYRESIAAAKKLHAAILTVVQNNNQVLDSSRNYTRISQVTQTIHRDKVTQTNPGRIYAAGNLELTGALNNQDSSVIVGGVVLGGKANNLATPGKQTITTDGIAIRYRWEFSGGFSRSQHLRASGPAPYTNTFSQSFDLPTVVFKEHQPQAEPFKPMEPNPNSGRNVVTASGRVVRTLEGSPALPQSSLYRVNTPNAHALVETDPTFTQGRRWLSAESMLQALALDPARLQKRLGDGFYEQQLVQQQISDLTGRRFLGDWRSNDAQYLALLQNGATFAKAHGLRPGVTLSAAQMAQLTSDLVWLVEQNITLPDGSQHTVLVPKVYVVARPTDLDPQGGLISGDQIVLKTDQDVLNSATLAGRRLVQISAHDINSPGRIAGEAVALSGERDINVVGGTVSAAVSLLAQAGRDITAATTTRGGTHTVLDRVAELKLGGDAGGAMVLSAGRNVLLQGARIRNTTEGGRTLIHAANDVDLSTVTTASAQRITWDAKNHLFFGGSQEVGSEIFTQGLTQILAGKDIHARAAQVQSTQHLAVRAGGSVQINAGQATQSLDDAFFAKRSGWFSSSSTTMADKVQATQAQASHFGGKTIDIQADQDIGVEGSNVVSDQDTVLHAGRNVAILAATDTSSKQSLRQSSRSGIFGGPGLGFTIGRQQQRTDQAATRTSAAASTVGSIAGSVQITAGQAYRQMGSDLVAPQADVSVIARKIAITGAPQSEQSQTHSSFRQSGLSFALSSPAISLAQTASSLADTAGKTSDARMQVLAAGAAALNVYGNRGALQSLVEGKPQDMGFRAAITLGSTRQQSDSALASSTPRPSQVQAGGNVSLIATGAGQDSNLQVLGSDITAARSAILRADNQVQLLAAENTQSMASSQSSRSAGIGVGLAYGSEGFAAGITAQTAHGKGHAESAEVVQRNTHVTAGQQLFIQSGGDTTLRGAVARGKQVVADVGGQLHLESLQDISSFQGRQQNLGGSVTMGVGIAGSAGYSRSRAQGDFASVTEQTGIFAGDSGFDIQVKGNTDFKGAAIVSSQAAIDNNRNHLVTGTLTHSDIDNRSAHQASGLDLSGGLTTSQGKTTGSDTVNNPTTWSWQNQGTGMDGAAAGVSRDQGQASSTTRSAIGPGAITITDEAGQRATTGQSAAEAVASIPREVRTDAASQGLGKDWDGQQLLQEQAANAQIVAAFGQQASRAVGTYADQKALKARISADDVTAEKWEEGGEYRTAMHTAIGAITGGLEGAAGAAVSSALLPEVGESIAALNLPEGVREALSTVLGTALGAVGGAPGATAGLNQAANNYVSHSPFPEVRRTVALENARLTKECGDTCTQEILNRNDRQVVQVETAANLVAISKISSMTQEQAQQLSQLILELIPILGSGESVLQLITGRSSLTGEETSRFWAAIGFVPVAGGVLKRVGKPRQRRFPSCQKK